MKILLAHNFYGSEAPSGENRVFVEEARLLREEGHRVIEFTRHSDRIRSGGAWGLIRGAASTPWNQFAASELRRLIAEEAPDILHVHNFFPLLSPAIFRAASGSPTATVLTLHNYRLFCAAGIPLRNNEVCTRCLDERSVLPALRFGCYRGSRLATLPIAAMIGLHRKMKTWQLAVDAFIALTPFQRDAMVAAGLPEKLVQIKPHFSAEPATSLAWEARERKVVYVGRLGPEKGISSLIAAWRLWPGEAPQLELIGDGPQRAALENDVRRFGLEGRITFRGQLSFAETQAAIAAARLLVLPSLSFEGFPMVILEAYAHGVPVVGSRLGSIPDIVREGHTGHLFRPGDSGDLFRTLQALWRDCAELEQMSVDARREFEALYTPRQNHTILMRIYESAIRVRQARLLKGRAVAEAE